MSKPSNGAWNVTSVCHRKTQTYLNQLLSHHALTISMVREFTNKELNIIEDNKKWHWNSMHGF